MKNIIVSVKKMLFAVLILLIAGNISNAQLIIISGVEGGSYHRFAKDIRGVADSVSIAVKTSNGSIENFKKLIEQKEMSVTFLQEDVLVHQQLKDLEEGTDNIEHIRILLPLGTEEIHLVTRNDLGIESIEDLEGMRVVVGTENQGTYITASLIKEMTGIGWEDVSIPFDEVFDALDRNEIDAFFFVGSYPVGNLVNLPEDKNFKLIPITNDRLEEIYTRTTIPANTYPWQKQEVETFSLRFVMATNVDGETKKKREMIAKMLRSIKRNYDILTIKGHDKWKEVDFEEDIKNLDWRVYETSAEIFNPPPVLGPNIKIYSGVEGGSYYQFAEDIRKITSPEDSVTVVHSNGSVDNLNQLITRRNIFVTFLQYDVLLQQRLRDMREYTNYTDNIKILLPMGLEEIHLVTRADEKIRSIKHLKHKRVAIGTVYQGTYVTARLIKGITRVNWEDVPIPFSEVYVALMNNQIDAFFFVGSAPVAKLFYLNAHNKIKMVPIKHSKLDKVYTPTVIKAGTYPWLKTDIETYAVRSVMATNIKGETPEQRKSIQKLLVTIKNKKDALMKYGHRKWKEVDFNFDHLDWDTYDGTLEVVSEELSEEMLENLNYKEENSETKLDVVEADSLKNADNKWFYIRVLTNDNNNEYMVLGTGSRMVNGELKKYEEGMLWGMERKQIAIGPFLSEVEAQNAHAMYRRTKPRLSKTIEDAKETLYWFHISFKEMDDKKYDLKEMPSRIDKGSIDNFLNALYKGMNYGLLTIGPFWSEVEAARAEKIYRKHE